ncbi:MAG: hypothetical protein HYT72_05845 [Candidatus Aenigmarchaeota archaeon]|nr:hypothetical protein [Candidatus Aenigmarchaeota archaeon]
MARKRPARKNNYHKHRPSVLTKDEFHLNPHDEEKLLLFVAGMLFGVGVSVSIVTTFFWFSGLATALIGAALFLIEYRSGSRR